MRTSRLAVLAFAFLLSFFGLAAQAADPSVAPAAVNINSADAQLIAERLDGVGVKKAEAIVAFRNANGPFTSPVDLVQVKGIGESTVERNLDRITLQ